MVTLYQGHPARGQKGRLLWGFHPFGHQHRAITAGYGQGAIDQRLDTIAAANGLDQRLVDPSFRT